MFPPTSLPLLQPQVWLLPPLLWVQSFPPNQPDCTHRNILPRIAQPAAAARPPHQT